MEDVRALPKRGANAERGLPLPIPVAGVHALGVRLKRSYVGFLKGRSVVVTDPEEAEMLHLNGFFGKKIPFVPAPDPGQSRGIKRSRLFKPLDVPCSETLSQRQYRRRMQWIDADVGIGEGVVGWQLKVEDCLVHDDTDLEDDEVDGNEDGGGGGRRRKPSAAATVSVERRHLPCKVVSALHLCPEEAVFLAHELRCLWVLDEDDLERPVTVERLWSLFRGEDFSFLARYASYLHLRAKRWVVKPGLKFGVDWLLYKEGPAYYHASMAVKVVAQDLSPTPSAPSASRFVDVPFSEMRSLARLSSVVSKQLVYVTVFVPPSASRPPELTDVRSTAVVCTFVRRWTPGDGDETKANPDPRNKK